MCRTEQQGSGARVEGGLDAEARDSVTGLKAGELSRHIAGRKKTWTAGLLPQGLSPLPTDTVTSSPPHGWDTATCTLALWEQAEALPEGPPSATEDPGLESGSAGTAAGQPSRPCPHVVLTRSLSQVAKELLSLCQPLFPSLPAPSPAAPTSMSQVQLMLGG